MAFARIEEHPAQWISISIMNVICTIIGFSILHSEIQQRNRNLVPFTTKSFKYLSISCITAGLLQNLFGLFRKVPGLCTFGRFMAIVSYLLQMGSMGFYQLSRLYYCFANDRIHSQKGYGLWLFIFMYILAIAFGLMHMIALCFDDNYWVFFAKCGYTESWEYYYEYHIDRQLRLTESTAALLTYMSILLYLLWDMATLFLYVVKIRQLHTFLNKEKLGIVSTRIMAILYKVTTLTIFYELGLLLIFLFQASLVLIFTRNSMYYIVSAGCIGAVFPLPFSIAMYLMLDHNKDGYFKFLKFIYRFKMYLICCCCRRIVTEQLKEMDNNVQNMTQLNTVKSDASSKTENISSGDEFKSNGNGDNAGYKNNELSLETHNNLSIIDPRINATGMELSVETVNDSNIDL